MEILMFGWEFPPFSSGGLGTACYGLTKSLSSKNVKVHFVVPKAPMDAKADFVDLIVASGLKLENFMLHKINSLLVPYIDSGAYNNRMEQYKRFARNSGNPEASVYGPNLYAEVHRYAEASNLIAREINFDIIHAHDWMTYPAALNAKRVSGKPLVIHVHATEFDRTGGHPNQYIYDIEREGMHLADNIIAVSNYTKNMIVRYYGIEPGKVTVVHNGVEFSDAHDVVVRKNPNEKIVLFLGRITLQKGPDYFVYAARKVLEKMKNVKFIVAGSGDMEPYMIEKAAEFGIADKMLFAGFLRGKDIERAYKMADLYVMPSVSEPFGITPLESIRNGTPVIISKTSGVSEVLQHALKVDFWDVDQLANKIIAVLQHDCLRHALIENSTQEIPKINWDVAADKCLDVYNRTIHMRIVV
jgi:glycosyltransferase involved in cell wall biosynthesis